MQLSFPKSNILGGEEHQEFGSRVQDSDWKGDWGAGCPNNRPPVVPVDDNNTTRRFAQRNAIVERNLKKFRSRCERTDEHSSPGTKASFTLEKCISRPFWSDVELRGPSCSSLFCSPLLVSGLKKKKEKTVKETGRKRGLSSVNLFCFSFNPVFVLYHFCSLSIAVFTMCPKYFPCVSEFLPEASSFVGCSLNF